MPVLNQDGSQQNDAQGEGQNQKTSYLDVLVQKRGENFKDPELMAKTILNGDEHIFDLENQIKESKEELSKESYSKMLLDRIEKGSYQGNEPNGNGVNTEDTTQYTNEDLSRLIDDTLAKRQTEAEAKANLAKADQELVKTFGSEQDAEQALNKRAEELSLPRDSLVEMASKSPEAFAALMGTPAKGNSNSGVEKASINTEAFMNSNSSERNAAYYSKLRKDNPALFRSPKIQMQREQDAARLGADFWST